ncbi:hypothetical protein [Iodobacter fluviatilis]|jgi:hypothetical protein|uniref:Lipoprotein n=1 Tax=Iodobacter fluviatilis TaxID=537 RepID=A0A7G3G5G7_9NEIS|nr:hypothetical protein [Iodobacter fluviatilis]QBC42517.1 hypothetical protein C1H71_02385 [Iodobacter fluviatilis]
MFRKEELMFNRFKISNQRKILYWLLIFLVGFASGCLCYKSIKKQEMEDLLFNTVMKMKFYQEKTDVRMMRAGLTQASMVNAGDINDFNASMCRYLALYVKNISANKTKLTPEEINIVKRTEDYIKQQPVEYKCYAAYQSSVVQAK